MFYINGTAPTVGGCQAKVGSSDKVLWAFTNSNTSRVLQLSGPDTVEAGKKAKYRVTYLDDDTPAKGASVTLADEVADHNGHVQVHFRHKGYYRLKAKAKHAVFAELDVAVGLSLT